MTKPLPATTCRICGKPSVGKICSEKCRRALLDKIARAMLARGRAFREDQTDYEHAHHVLA